MKKVILILSVCLAMIAIVLVVSASTENTGNMVCAATGTIITEPETMVMETIPETTAEAITTALETTPITIPRYNVNLSTEVQECIITECEKYNIPPEIVIAMIERESRFNSNAIGDNGNSFGLMQIQPRWHSGRMAKLGCTDLLNPIENVKVGIDYLGELYNRYGDIGKALTAYNTGSYTGTITYYTIAVMKRANEI